jgi:hypothetical protein
MAGTISSDSGRDVLVTAAAVTSGEPFRTGRSKPRPRSRLHDLRSSAPSRRRSTVREARAGPAAGTALAHPGSGSLSTPRSARTGSSPGVRRPRQQPRWAFEEAEDDLVAGHQHRPATARLCRAALAGGRALRGTAAELLPDPRPEALREIRTRQICDPGDAGPHPSPRNPVFPYFVNERRVSHHAFLAVAESLGGMFLLSAKTLSESYLFFSATSLSTSGRRTTPAAVLRDRRC